MTLSLMNVFFRFKQNVDDEFNYLLFHCKEFQLFGDVHILQGD